MNQRATNSFGLWAMTALILMNVALIGLLWYEHFGKRPAQPVHIEVDRDELFARELLLDQQQTDSVKTLRDKHFQRQGVIIREISVLNRQILDELFAAVPDTLRVQALVDQIGQHQAQIERQIYEHFSQIKALCRPEQHQRLERLIHDVVRLKGQPPPPGVAGPAGNRPPPGGHPPPHGEPPKGP